MCIDIGITRLVMQGEKLIRRSKAEERHDSEWQKLKARMFESSEDNKRRFFFH